ncbi:MAG: hypothetical protein KAJ86_04100 [Alphaproteobacteria bacterium]|nr:hypothetical protein [Alphaproteobacteria bacterium]
MIKVLGIKRILIIVILLVANIVLAAVVYVYIDPEKANKERELQVIRGKNSGVQSDVIRLQIEFDQLEMQQDQFDALKKEGFLGTQDRRLAEQLFAKIGKEAGVIRSVASMQGGTIEDNDEAGKAFHKILRSPILVEIDAFDDVDVFRYIYLVEKFFPGHITIEYVNIERKGDVTGAVLRGIAGGKNPELVAANIEMIWRTMIPEKDIIKKVEGSL